MKQVLYRTYRPTNFDEIYGQDHIISILKNQIKNNTIAHAYLFCGPRGTGKTSTARIFAKELNGGSELDIIELDAASHNKVEDIREIVDKLSLAPFDAKYKVYILDEVHMLSTSAFNAFLKSLEEPPAHIIFILATTEPHKLPQTILSRTQRFDFNKISNSQILDRLKFVLKKENIPFAEDALVQIANKSDGGLRDALGLLDKVISYGDVSVENVSKALGIFSSEIYVNLFEAVISNDVSNALEILNLVDEYGVDSKVFVLDFIKNLKDAILIQNNVNLDNVLAKQISLKAKDSIIAFIIEEMGKTLNALRFSSNAKIELLANIVSLCSVKFENIAIYKNLPANFQNEINRQNTIIQALEKRILYLEQKLQNLHTYPQNFVDKDENNVDKTENIIHSEKKEIYDLSTEQNKNDFTHSEFIDIQSEENIDNINNDTFNDESNSQELLNKIKDIMPEIKQKLKEKRKISIFSVFSMARPIKFENGEITFIFEDDKRKMIDIMKKSKPEEFIDVVISEILGFPIKTVYITDDIIIDKDYENNLIKEKITSAFPDVNFRIV